MKSIGNVLFKAIKTANIIEKKQVSVVWIGAAKELIDQFESINIPVFDDIPEAIETLAQLYKGYHRQSFLLKDNLFLSSVEETLTIEKVEEKEKVYYLTEYDTKKRYRNYDVPLPQEILVQNVKDALTKMQNSGLHYPVVLKIQSTEMLHKSEHGGLLLNISDENHLIHGITQLLDRSKHLAIEIQGILIQEMVHFDQALIIGFQRDKIFGPTLVLGSGGIHVEVLKDITTLYLPVSKETVIQKIKCVKSSKFFEGYRGKKKIDIEQLADIILTLSSFFLKHEKEISELEINPLAIDSKSGQFWILDGTCYNKKVRGSTLK